jgi:hypothetical protein
MLLNYTLGLVLIVVLALAIIVLFAWLWKKMKLKPVAGGTIGFFISCVVCVGFWVTAGRVYVVTAPNEYSKYILYGTSSYETQNGHPVICKNSDDGALLINDTQEDLVIQQVIYGYGGSPNDRRLEAQKSMYVGYSEVHYFFDEEPPNSIETEGYGYVVRLWVIMEEDYDFILQDDIDHIRDLLEKSIEEKAQEKESQEEE